MGFVASAQPKIPVDLSPVLYTDRVETMEIWLMVEAEISL